MKKTLPQVIEQSRVREGPMASDSSYGLNGVFMLSYNFTHILTVIVSDQEGWDHISVEWEGRKACPTWEMMSWVKRMFFEDTEWAVEFHPPVKKNISIHPYVLHLFRPQNVDIPVPPREFV